MLLAPAAWILVPLLGGLIGYATNRIAIMMVFRPLRPVRVLGLRVQGLVGRRQPELAASIGRVVGSHLLQHDDVVRALDRVDLERLVSDILQHALERKVAELRRLPLVGSLFTEGRVADLRDALVRGFLADRERLSAHLGRAIEQGLDVREVVEKKVASFPVERIEELVLEVARKELRAIELLGGVLGVLIGFVQVAVLSVV